MKITTIVLAIATLFFTANTSAMEPWEPDGTTVYPFPYNGDPDGQFGPWYYPATDDNDNFRQFCIDLVEAHRENERRRYFLDNDAYRNLEDVPPSEPPMTLEEIVRERQYRYLEEKWQEDKKRRDKEDRAKRWEYCDCLQNPPPDPGGLLTVRERCNSKGPYFSINKNMEVDCSDYQDCIDNGSGIFDPDGGDDGLGGCAVIIDEGPIDPVLLDPNDDIASNVGNGGFVLAGANPAWPQPMMDVWNQYLINVATRFRVFWEDVLLYEIDYDIARATLDTDMYIIIDDFVDDMTPLVLFYLANGTL